MLRKPGENPRMVRTTLGSGVVLCVGVILVPFALLFLMLVPVVGAALGIASVAAMLFGTVGVLGAFR